MLAKISKLFIDGKRNSYIYVFSNLLSALIPFACIPIITKNLDSYQYGRVAIFQSLITGIGCFIGLNVNLYCIRRFYDDKKNIDKHISASIYILIIMLLSIMIIGFFSSFFYNEILGLPIVWVYAAIISASLNFLIYIRLGQWQVLEKGLSYAFLQVSFTGANFSIFIIFLVFFHYDETSRVISQSITVTIFSLLCMVSLKKDRLIALYCSNIKVYIKKILSFSLPYLPHSIGFFILNYFDKILISQLVGFHDFGIYMVAFQFSSVLSLLFDAMNRSYTPWLFNQLKKDTDEIKENIIKKFYIFSIYALISTLILCIIIPIIMGIVVSESYNFSGKLVTGLILGQLFQGGYYFIVNYIVYSERNSILSIITVINGAIYFFMIVCMVDNFGVVGAVYAFLISKALYFFITLYYANYVYPMPWIKFKRLLSKR